MDEQNLEGIDKGDKRVLVLFLCGVFALLCHLAGPSLISVLRSQGGESEAIIEVSETADFLNSPKYQYISGNPLPINRASAETLTLLPGIGPELALRIVALRKEEGGIKGPEALARVPGLGPKKIKQLISYIRFD